MKHNQKEIEKRIKEDPFLTKSQKQHLKKVIKRKNEKEKRINEMLKQQEFSNKLIEENHNGNDYSIEFIEKAENYYLDYLKNSWLEYSGNAEKFLLCFRKIKDKLQTLVLKWPPKDRNTNFEKFVGLLDTYRQNKNDGTNLLTYYYINFTQ